MDSDTRRESARIYRFAEARAAKREAVPAIPAAPIPAGRGWYHDVAIRDARSKTPEPRG